MSTNTKQGSGGQTSQKQMSSKKKRARKRNKIIIFSVEIVVILVMLGALYLLRDFGKTSISRIELQEEELNISQKVVDSTVTKGYRNIALFGLDSRGGSLEKGSRSDSIMVVSINQDTGDVKLLSIYRDTYLNLSNDKYGKCNGAYSSGGAKQAIKMLNMNLDLDITDFVAIGFGGLRDVIDELGGIELEITNAEIGYLNDYQLTMSEDLKTSYKPVKQAGVQTVDGLQAVAYCRIRYTKGDDFKRAERQRTVIQAIVDKARGEKLTTLTKIANAVAGNVYTSLSMDEIIGVMGEMAKYNIVDEAGFPHETYRATGKIKTADSVLPMDLEKNVQWMYEFLFDEKDYTPSDTVKEFSQEIRSIVAKNLPDLTYPAQ